MINLKKTKSTALATNNEQYTIDLDEIEKYIFKDNDNNSSEKEITDLYQYGVSEDENEDASKTLNTKQIRELKVTNGNQISTLRYDFMRMLIDNIQYIPVDGNDIKNSTYNAYISFNTLLNYGFIKKIN